MFRQVATGTKSYQMALLSLGWQEIKIAMGEQILVLCSALKWRVAIVIKQIAPMAKLARVWRWGTSQTPLSLKQFWSGLPLLAIKWPISSQVLIIRSYQMVTSLSEAVLPCLAVSTWWPPQLSVLCVCVIINAVTVNKGSFVWQTREEVTSLSSPDT